MILTHRPIEHWPDDIRIGVQYSPFSASWSSTLKLLERELNHLGARSPVVLQLAVGEDAIRLDGQVRADARAKHPGVILAFETRKLGNISIPCGQFTDWQANVRAIALGLEALRRVERFGAAKMSVDEAARLLVDEGEWGDAMGDPEYLIDDPDVARAYYRHAAKRHHPDAGGDPDLFRRLTEARDLLVGAS